MQQTEKEVIIAGPGINSDRDNEPTIKEILQREKEEKIREQYADANKKQTDWLNIVKQLPYSVSENVEYYLKAKTFKIDHMVKDKKYKDSEVSLRQLKNKHLTELFRRMVLDNNIKPDNSMFLLLKIEMIKRNIKPRFVDLPGYKQKTLPGFGEVEKEDKYAKRKEEEAGSKRS